MTKYINADLLKSKNFGRTIRNAYHGEGTDFFLGEDWKTDVIDAKLLDTVIDNPPAADVVPVKRGKWIRQSDKRKALYGWYFCSECGATIGGKCNFCSECGADMREVDE